MNWDQLEGTWNVFAGSARAHWSKLTEEDWQTITGRKDQLVRCVRERYGIPEEAAEKQVEGWARALFQLPDLRKAHQ